MRKLIILFWKCIAILWDLRLRIPFKYKDYPIASTDIADEYSYPEGTKVLYEWDEKGRHWIIFTR